MNLRPKEDEIANLKRIEALLSFQILDTDPEAEFDELAKLAAIICESPMAHISFLDDHRQWFKASVGLGLKEVPIEQTVCQDTIRQNTLLEIEDLHMGVRYQHIELLFGDPPIRFYAGQPIITEEGYALGTLCVLDHLPKSLDEKQKEALASIARQVQNLLKERKNKLETYEILHEVVKDKIDQAERNLAQKDREINLLQKAINKSSAALMFDPEGNILEVNDNFLRLFGYKRDELIGKHHQKLLVENDLEENRFFWKKLSTGNFFKGKVKRKAKSGEILHLLVTYTPIADESGHISKVLKIAQDVTKETLYEISLSKEKHAAERAVISKDNFLANMSHEIRTPMNAILGFTDLLLETPLSHEQKDLVKPIKFAGDNLLSIINNILDLSKIENEEIAFERQSFHFRKILDQVREMLRHKYKEKGLFFNLEIEENIPAYLKGDAHRLSQILINLINNAIKFTESGGITVIAKILDELEEKLILQIEVKDTGIGIPEEKLDYIFERFTQATEDTTRKYGGTGLGLNITRKLIELQGGEIRVKSELGKGSSFIFTLPFGRISDEEKIVSDDHQDANVSLAGRRILLCEDTELNVKLAVKVLESAGATVDIASNGKEAIEKLKNPVYDVVLMDIQMPEMDGYESTYHIREKMGLSLPIIAMTAHSFVKEKEKCLKLGMNDYISKPFRKHELITKINFHVGQVHDLRLVKEIQEEELIHGKILLQELSGGNVEFEKEMVGLFLQQVPNYMTNIKQLLTKGNFKEIKQLVHKLKSSLSLMAWPAFIEFVQEIELDPKLLKEKENYTKWENNMKKLCETLAETYNLTKNGV